MEVDQLTVVGAGAVRHELERRWWWKTRFVVALSLEVEDMT